MGLVLNMEKFSPAKDLKFMIYKCSAKYGMSVVFKNPIRKLILNIKIFLVLLGIQLMLGDCLFKNMATRKKKIFPFKSLCNVHKLMMLKIK